MKRAGQKTGKGTGKGTRQRTGQKKGQDRRLDRGHILLYHYTTIPHINRTKHATEDRVEDLTEDRTENIKGDRTEDRTRDRAGDRTEETHTTGQKTGQDRRYITIPVSYTHLTLPTILLV